MFWRRIIGGLAILGVLMHAGVVVRHGAIMLGAKFAEQELAMALGGMFT